MDWDITSKSGESHGTEHGQCNGNSENSIKSRGRVMSRAIRNPTSVYISGVLDC